MSYLRELEAVVDELRRGRSVALAVLVKKSGSAPRDVGARMVIKKDGHTIGTLGGGSFERKVVEEALAALSKGETSVKKYVFREEDVQDAEKTGLICGGETDVFLDVLKSAPRVLLIGAGHLAHAIAEIGSKAGFRVAVADSDPQLASRERFAAAEKIVVDDFERCVERLEPSKEDMVLVLSGVVEEDFKVLLKALEASPRYIGMLGSRRKCGEFLRRLKDMGYTEEQLRGRVYMPTGIDIGADKPEEIAVAVVAEIISLLKGGDLKHLTIV